MKTYTYSVKMLVTVEAFDEDDAFDAVQDAFGVGEQMGVTVTDCSYKETNVNSRRR